MRQRFEAAGARRVVLEVVRVHVQRGEELRSDAIVAALGEVARVDEVAAAEVHADVHVRGDAGDAVIIQGDVEIEELVGGVRVGRVFFPAFEHLLGAEVLHGSVSTKALYVVNSVWDVQAKFGSSNCTLRSPALYRMSNSTWYAFATSAKYSSSLAYTSFGYAFPSTYRK